MSHNTKHDNAYDWQDAFNEASGAGFRGRALRPERDAALVQTVERRVAGMNEEADWLALGTTVDGQWWGMRAGCDYTGWDCRASGDFWIRPTREAAYAEFTVDEQLRLEAHGQDGWWPCSAHDDCCAHSGVAAACAEATWHETWRGEAS